MHVHQSKAAHLSEAYKEVNSLRLVPALDTADQVLIRSPAIIEWQGERFPQPLLPIADP